MEGHSLKTGSNVINLLETSIAEKDACNFNRCIVTNLATSHIFSPLYLNHMDLRERSCNIDNYKLNPERDSNNSCSDTTTISPDIELYNNNLQNSIYFPEHSHSIDDYRLHPERDGYGSCSESEILSPLHILRVACDQLYFEELLRAYTMKQEKDLKNQGNDYLRLGSVSASVSAVPSSVSTELENSNVLAVSTRYSPLYLFHMKDNSECSRTSVVHSLPCDSENSTTSDFVSIRSSDKQLKIDEYQPSEAGTYAMSDCPVIYSPINSQEKLDCKVEAKADQKPKKKRVSFKLPHTVFGEKSKRKPQNKEEELKYSHKVACPHTGCKQAVSVKAGRLTSHFKHYHRSIQNRFIIRNQEEYFILNVPKQLYNCNCFYTMKMQYTETLPLFTLLLMLTRFNELVNYKLCCKVLIWVLTDEKTIPINITLAFGDELVQCRARTLEDIPDLTNCLNLSRKAVKKFNKESGGYVTLKVL